MRIWALLLLLTSISAGNAAQITRPYAPGEKLTYHFYYGPLMVGTGTFLVLEDEKKDRLQFRVNVRSNNFISAIYPVEADLVSLFDTNHRRSISFLQDRHEGKSHIWEETFFFYQQKHAEIISYTSGESKWFEIPEDRVVDKLSTIYYMRGLNWTSRNNAEVKLGNDKQNYTVTMTKLGTEIIDLDDFQPIPVFKVQPNTEYLGGFVKKGVMYVWVSDDELKVPIKVVAQLPFGTVSAVLTEVEGVKNWPYFKE